MARLGRSEEQTVRLRSDDDLKTYVDTLSGHGPLHESVVEVDRDDDLTSVRSKLESVRVPRAVLVIPGSVKTLGDGLQFRVLRRLQRELGLDLVVVSDDLNRRGLARENGFRNVFGSLRSYYRSRNSAPDTTDGVPFTDPEEFTPALGVGRWGVVVAGILAALLMALAYLALPVAEVVVYPETQTLVRDVDVLVEIGGPRIDLVSQRLAGRVLEERVQVGGSIDVKEVPLPPRPETSNPQAPGLQPGVNVTLEVRDALRQRMLSQAKQQAVARLTDQLRGSESMPEESIRVEIASERYDHNIGDAAERLSGSMEVVATGLAFNNDDFNRLVFALWSQDIPRDYRSATNPDLTPPSVVSAEGRHMILRVRATGRLEREVDTGAVVAAVRGRTLEEAEQLASNLDGFARAPNITLWPDWADRALRVQVRNAGELSSGPQ